MKNLKRIYCMIGLPCSGKTTLVKKIIEKEPRIVVVSADTLRKTIFGRDFFEPGEEIVWAVRKYMLMSLMSWGNPIIIDETNLTKYRREKIINLAGQFDYEVYGLILDTPKEVCIERAYNDNNTKIVPIIREKSLTCPDKTEGFKDIKFICKDTDIRDFISVKDLNDRVRGRGR